MKTANKIMMPNGEEIGIDGLYGKITNCLLEVPQRIKLELNDGVLTLKAGSQVIVPNGFEDDGVTPRFDYVDIESDINYYNESNTDAKFIFVNRDGMFIRTMNTTVATSGSVAPSTFMGNYAQWYDTTNNIMKNTNDKGSTWSEGDSLPICIATMGGASGNIASINQTFNGLGYIGSTVWVDKGVKGLIPNGRNEDGTLRNIEYTTDKFYVDTAPSNVNHINTLTFTLDHIVNGVYYPIVRDTKYYQQSTLPTDTACLWYNSDTNEMYSKRTGFDGGILKTKALVLGEATYVDGKITFFNPKQPFRAVDYSDKAEVAGWGMPSSKYIDLTLNASESTYTAPANGWFAFSKKNASANQSLHVKVNNVTRFHQTQAVTGQAHAFFEQVNKGDVLYIGYSLSGETQCFRFYYCNGEV